MDGPTPAVTENAAPTTLALDEMRLCFDKTWSASDTLKETGNLLVAVAGVALAVAATFQDAPDAAGPKAIYLGAIGLGFALFVVLAATVLAVGQPEIYRQPIAAKWVDVYQNVIALNETEAMQKLIVGYIQSITHNEEVNRERARHIQTGSILLVVIVFLVLAANFVAILAK